MYREAKPKHNDIRLPVIVKGAMASQRNKPPPSKRMLSRSLCIMIPNIVRRMRV